MCIRDSSNAPRVAQSGARLRQLDRVRTAAGLYQVTDRGRHVHQLVHASAAAEAGIVALGATLGFVGVELAVATESGAPVGQHRAFGGWADETPFVTAYIDLAEGDRMFTVLRGVDPTRPETIKIGAKVKVEFEAASADVHIPFWRVV